MSEALNRGSGSGEALRDDAEAPIGNGAAAELRRQDSVSTISQESTKENIAEEQVPKDSTAVEPPSRPTLNSASAPPARLTDEERLKLQLAFSHPAVCNFVENGRPVPLASGTALPPRPAGAGTAVGGGQAFVVQASAVRAPFRPGLVHIPEARPLRAAPPREAHAQEVLQGQVQMQCSWQPQPQPPQMPRPQQQRPQQQLPPEVHRRQQAQETAQAIGQGQGQRSWQGHGEGQPGSDQQQWQRQQRPQQAQQPQHPQLQSPCAQQRLVQPQLQGQPAQQPHHAQTHFMGQAHQAQQSQQCQPAAPQGQGQGQGRLSPAALELLQKLLPMSPASQQQGFFQAQAAGGLHSTSFSPEVAAMPPSAVPIGGSMALPPRGVHSAHSFSVAPGGMSALPQQRVIAQQQLGRQQVAMLAPSRVLSFGGPSVPAQNQRRGFPSQVSQAAPRVQTFTTQGGYPAMPRQAPPGAQSFSAGPSYFGMGPRPGADPWPEAHAPDMRLDAMRRAVHEARG